MPKLIFAPPSEDGRPLQLQPYSVPQVPGIFGLLMSYKPDDGFVAVCNGKTFEEPFRPVGDDHRNLAMYPKGTFTFEVGCQPNVRTRDDVCLTIKMSATVQIRDFVKYDSMADDADNDIWYGISGEFQNPINSRLKGEDYSVSLRTREYLKSLVEPEAFLAAKKKLARFGVELIAVTIDDLKPHFERAFEGATPMSTEPEDATALAIMHNQFGVTLPDVFDYGRIKADAEKMAKVGLVEKFLHAAFRRFETKAEVSLLQALEKYYKAGTATARASHELQRVELEHQEFIEKKKADILNHQARGAKAIAEGTQATTDTVRAIIELKDLVEKAAQSGQASLSQKTFAEQVREAEEAMERELVELDMIKDPTLRERSQEEVRQKWAQRINHIRND